MFHQLSLARIASCKDDLMGEARGSDNDSVLKTRLGSVGSIVLMQPIRNSMVSQTNELQLVTV